MKFEEMNEYLRENKNNIVAIGCEDGLYDGKKEKPYFWVSVMPRMKNKIRFKVEKPNDMLEMDSRNMVDAVEEILGEKNGIKRYRYDNYNKLILY